MYCKLCQKYSSHEEKNCPEGVDLWHGTRVNSLSEISMSKGLNPSPHNRRLGRGIYFTDKYSATGISHDKGEGSGVVVIGCRVWLGNTKNFGSSTGKNWHGQYDSASAIHPPWKSVSTFTEYCLKDESRQCIKEVLLIGGVVNGEVHLPGVDIRILGNVTFNCNVTAGNLTLG